MAFCLVKAFYSHQIQVLGTLENRAPEPSSTVFESSLAITDCRSPNVHTCNFFKAYKREKKSLPPATVTAGAINLVLSSSTTTDRAARQGTKDQALPPEVWCTSPGSAGSSGIHGDSSFSAQRKLIQHKRKERGSKIKCLLL